MPTHLQGENTERIVGDGSAPGGWAKKQHGLGRLIGKTASAVNRSPPSITVGGCIAQVVWGGEGGVCLPACVPACLTLPCLPPGLQRKGMSIISRVESLTLSENPLGINGAALIANLLDISITPVQVGGGGGGMGQKHLLCRCVYGVGRQACTHMQGLNMLHKCTCI